MNLMTVTIKPNRKVHIEMDADRFERLAADLGLFTNEFLASVDRAEQDIAKGKARPLRSLKDLHQK